MGKARLLGQTSNVILVVVVVVVVEHAMCCVISSGPEPKPEFKGDERTFRLWLDTNQYQQDMAETVHGSEVNLLVFMFFLSCW